MSEIHRLKNLLAIAEGYLETTKKNINYLLEELEKNKQSIPLYERAVTELACEISERELIGDDDRREDRAEFEQDLPTPEEVRGILKSELS